MNTLPTCIKARRMGHSSMGSENEYDSMGEQAPITWTCNCGQYLTLEQYNYNTDEYTATPQVQRDEFLAAHTTCVAMCFNCGTVPVDRQGYWCEPCSDEPEGEYITPF